MDRVTANGSSLGLRARVQINRYQYWNLSLPNTPSLTQARKNARNRCKSAGTVAAGTLSSFKIDLSLKNRERIAVEAQATKAAIKIIRVKQAKTNVSF
jgi:hypothetical protein